MNSPPHSEEFEKNYLHLAGNLALLTKSQNSQFSNKSFAIKQDLFKLTTLTSYSEIHSQNQWAEDEINSRHQKIMQFTQQYFDISAL